MFSYISESGALEVETESSCSPAVGADGGGEGPEQATPKQTRKATAAAAAPWNPVVATFRPFTAPGFQPRSLSHPGPGQAKKAYIKVTKLALRSRSRYYPSISCIRVSRQTTISLTRGPLGWRENTWFLLKTSSSSCGSRQQAFWLAALASMPKRKLQGLLPYLDPHVAGAAGVGL